MTKERIYKVLFSISIILLGLFVITTIIDYINYNSTLNSAPFYVFILVNAIIYVLPSAILAVIAFILKRKSKSKNKQIGDK